MKLKLLAVILFLAALFSGVVLWRVDRFVYGDRLAWAEAQARSQMSSLTQAINSEILSARRMLSTVSADTFKSDKTNWKVFQPYYSIALMTSQNGNLAITRMAAKAGSPAATWTPAQLGQYIGFMGKELESRGKVLLRSFRDPKKQSHVAVIFAGGGHAYILVGSGENFQSVIESQRGSMNSFSIIASDGLTVSHGTQEYIGTVQSDSTLLKEIRSTGAAQGVGVYQQGKKQIFGMYEQVPGTSDYVISSVPIEELFKGRLSLAWQFVFLVVGIGLIGTAVYVWYERKTSMLPGEPENISDALTPSLPAMEKPQTHTVSPRNVPTAQMPTQMPTPMAAPKAPASTPQKVTSATSQNADSLPTPPPRPPSVVTKNSQLVAPMAPVPMATHPNPEIFKKEDIYRQVAGAMGNEMRAPLASILGFSQMVLSKTQDPEVVQAVESILREARSSREVLEKLSIFSGERATEKMEVKIEGVIMQALKNLDTTLQQKGVKVEKDFKDSPPWPLAFDEMVKVFENLFTNSIEGMDRMQDKKIKISTWEGHDGLHVQVADSGEGIETENLKKVFDPFFTTRSFSQHTGLGLSVVAGILKNHHAEISLQSLRGQGTQVDMVFDKLAAYENDAIIKPRELPQEILRATAVTPEEKVQEQTARPKLTDVNVDSLLDMPTDDMPLQFLDGMGFDDPPPTAPLPKVTTKPVIAEPIVLEEVPEIIEPAMAQAPPPDLEPVTDPGIELPKVADKDADIDMPTVVAPPAKPAAPPPPVMKAAAPVADPEPEPEAVEIKMDAMNFKIPDTVATIRKAPEPEPVPVAPVKEESPPSAEIDKPTRAQASSSSALDSYKVEIRRPGKRD